MMTPRDKAAVITACVSITVSVIKIVTTVKEERRKREHIRAEGARDIDAIHYAAAEVHKNIHAGEYKGKGLNVLFDDLKFYEIAHRAEKG